MGVIEGDLNDANGQDQVIGSEDMADLTETDKSAVKASSAVMETRSAVLSVNGSHDFSPSAVEGLGEESKHKKRPRDAFKQVCPFFFFHIAINVLPIMTDGYIVSAGDNADQGIFDYYQGIGKPITDNQWSTFVSMYMGGAMVGGLVAGPAVKLVGPKRLLMCNDMCYVIAAILFASTQVFWVMILARSIQGFAFGINNPTTGLLIQESTPAPIRGVVTMGSMCSMSIGNILGFVIGMSSIMGTASLWYWMYAISIFPPVIHFVVAFFLPESPRWLVGEGRKEDAAQSLKRLRNPNYDFTEDLDKMEAALGKAVLSVRDMAKTLFTNKRFIHPLLIACIYPVAVQFILGSFVFYYSRTLFEELGFNNSEIATVLVGVVMLCSNLACSIFVERMGRRGMILFSWCCTVVLAILFCIACVNSGSDAWNKAGITIFMFYCFLGNGATLLSYIISPELFTADVRPVAVGISCLFSRCGSFLSAKVFLNIMDALGDYTFMLFAGICCGSLCLAYLFFPETSGVSLDNVGSLYDHHIYASLDWTKKLTKKGREELAAKKAAKKAAAVDSATS